MIRFVLPVALTLVMAHPAFACGSHKDAAACDPKACHATVGTDTKVGAQRTDHPDAVTKTLTVSGMSCAGCGNKLSKSLTQNPAITSASVDVAKGLATVTFIKDKITEAEITALIEKAGFKADKAHS